MELKYSRCRHTDMIIFSSNRTFMELKYGRIPLAQLGNLGSNRTFMELKLVTLSCFLATTTF